MCTAVAYHTNDHYFGRNLDQPSTYPVQIAITPRNYPLKFRKVSKILDNHYAIIGVAYVINGEPLYYDACNEKGLGIAGLEFAGYCVYHPEEKGKDNLPSYELIPWILGQCATVEEARKLLDNISMLDLPFSSELPQTGLHWIVSDAEETIVIESMEDGLKVYDDPYNVLTNDPPFPYHLLNAKNYIHMTRDVPKDEFAGFPIKLDGYGFGAYGLPGDLTPASRFIRAAYTNANSSCDGTEAGSVAQFFHILGSACQPRGCAACPGGYMTTLYSSCYNKDKGILYYMTYDNGQICAVDMHRTDLDTDAITVYPMIETQKVHWQN